MTTRTTSRDPGPDATTIEVLFAGEVPRGAPTPNDLAAVDDRFVVSQSTDFVGARNSVDAGAPDCVVAVHRSDGFDGLAFLESIRVEHPALPVVLVPAEVDGEVARRAVAADVTVLVPATDSDALDSLVDAIDEHAEASRNDDPVRMPISDLTVESEHRLKERALDEAPIGITISDATRSDQPIIYVNDSFEDMTGYSPKEVVGANHRFLQGPKTDPDQVAKLADGIETDQDTRVVLRNYTRDGAMFWNQVDISPIFDDDGEVTHYVGFQMDVTERKAAREQLEAERETLDRLLDRVNGLLNDVTESLVRAESRTDIERLLTERIGGGDEYAGAWLGRYNPTEKDVTVSHRAGDVDVADGTTFDVDGDADAAGVRTLGEAVRAQETRIVDDTAGLPTAGVGAGDAYLLVPLAYRGTTYGVLAVIDDAGLADGRERVVLEALGRSVGTSINDALTRRTITADTVLKIGVELVDDDIVLVDLASTLDTRFEHEATIPEPDNDEILSIVSTTHDDISEVTETAADHPDVLDTETLVRAEDESVVQFRLANSPVIDALSGLGSRITDMSADTTTLTLDFRVGTERAASRALDVLRGNYDRVELVAYREDTPNRTPHAFREELRNDLTERQYVALKKAYVSGYFEWPRRVEGEQLADSMGIVASTYHQHLQAAKRKLVEAFFDE
ncbi:bacterio-opsin activator domain-containing protein [Haloplanus natans]|uniref:bacterio-opsin activator domain-containing protein n=1 Tax=Haloplanus natans TaxID=376171 RepID=UPI000677B761|nr:bacterio-opsin activator domain-containing protein [Haloplanus natans]